MEFLAEEGVVDRGRITSSYHNADACVVQSDKGLVHILTVIFEEMVHCTTAHADDCADHMNKQGN